MAKTDPSGRYRDKLVATKTAWARDRRRPVGKPGDRRLPPGQHLVKDWPVLDLGVTPHVRPTEWRLTVDGAVATPLDWDWPCLMDQPQIFDKSDIHCVTAWSRYDNRWQGVSTAHLLAEAGPAADAAFVLVRSYDGYSTNLPLAALRAPGVMLAHAWEEAPLTDAHGGPVRLVVPQLYFWKSAKWVKRITVLTRDHPGFWELRGYHNRGDPWAEQRYA